MVVDQTGSLAGVKRHDYLPFGEAIGAGMGGRAAALGYNQPANVRQKFTGYERDDETALDFAQARYHSPAQGRFTSVDPENAGANLYEPQSWNGYAYVHNNPLNLVDPNGLSASTAGAGAVPGCSADLSYERCGGDSGFWGGGEFGDAAVTSSDLRGMPSSTRAGLLGYEHGVNNATYGGGKFYVDYFTIFYWQYEDGSLETMFHLDGGTVGGYNPLWEVTSRFNRYAPAMKGTILVVTGANLLPMVVGGASGALAGSSVMSLGVAEVTAATTARMALNAILRSAGQLTKLKGGVRQGIIRGNPQQIFQNLTQGATQLPSGAFKLADGTIVKLYTSITYGEASIFIKAAAQSFKIRILP